MIWSFARLSFLHPSLIDFLAAKVLHGQLPEFEPQHLANTAWSLAAVGSCNLPFLNAIAEEALLGMNAGHNFRPQEIAGILWAFAKLVFEDVPVLDAISKEM